MGGLAGTRRIAQHRLEDRLAFRVERDDPQAGGRRFLAEATPNHHPFKGKRGSEIQFPPGIVARASLRDRPGRRIPRAVTVDRPSRIRSSRGRRLAGSARGGDIAAARNHLNLRQRQHSSLAGQLNAHKASDTMRQGGPDGRAHPGDHEIALGSTRSFAGQVGVGQRLETESRESLSGGRGDLHRRGVLGLPGSHFHAGLRVDRDGGAGGTPRFRRPRGDPQRVRREVPRPAPGGLRVDGTRGIHFRHQRSDLRIPPFARPLLLGGEELQQRRLVVPVGVLRLVEEGVHPEVVVQRDRVVLMRVALGARHRGAHPHRQSGVDPVDHRHCAELLVVGATLGVVHRVPVESGRDQLRARRLRQEVASDLLDGKTVEGQVGVERVDHPVAVRPDAAGLVVRVALRVGVARQVEPAARPMLPVGGFRQLPVDESLVGAGRTVGGERLHLLKRGRQPRQIKCHPARQCMATRLGLRPHAGPLEMRQDETVDRVARPRGIPHNRRLRSHRRLVGPMAGIGGSARDPAPKGVDLARRQLLPGLRRRHQFVGIRGDETLQQLTLVGLAGDDRKSATAQVLHRALPGVEPQPLLSALPAFLVRAMAKEAIVRKDWTDLAVEIGHVGREEGRGGREQGNRNGEQPHGRPNWAPAPPSRQLRRLEIPFPRDSRLQRVPLLRH